jgi:hypothetical protein
MTTTWRPLREAFEHVRYYERSRGLTARRLLRAFADKVCTRGYVVYIAGREREGMEEPLSRELFTAYDGCPPAAIDWQDDSARLDRIHPFGPCEVYRIEVCWEDVLAIWPAQPAVRSQRGRKPTHDRELVLAEAEDVWRTQGPFHTVESWQSEVRMRLVDKYDGRPVPERSYLMKLLSPLYAERSAN